MTDCPLSHRQLETIDCLSEGMTYKQIAQALGISVSTVRTHLSYAYKRLGVVDRAQAVIYCERHGWLERTPTLTPQEAWAILFVIENHGVHPGWGGADLFESGRYKLTELVNRTRQASASPQTHRDA
jgi:DNA-binding CsgD family transcriptional regulator